MAKNVTIEVISLSDWSIGGHYEAILQGNAAVL